MKAVAPEQSGVLELSGRGPNAANVIVPPAPAGTPERVAVSEIEPPICASVELVVSDETSTATQFAPMLTLKALVSIELSPF